MKLRSSLVAAALIATTSLMYAQQNSLSIGTTQINNKAVLWLVPNASGQGLLLPVVSTAVRNGMGLQAADRGMIVYDNTDNSVYLWNGTAWNNLAGGSVATFTGANGITVTGNTISTDAIRPSTNASGDLTGTFANPQIANNAVTTAKIANDAVDNSKIANVNPSKLTQAAATSGQVLKWSGTAWAPADDLSAALTAGTGISIASNVITNTGLLTTSTAAGEVTGTFANLQIANGVVTDVKLADNAVTTAKLANNAVIASKIADGNVTTTKIADNAINTAKVQDANITTAKIADGAVTDAKLGSGIAVNKLAPGANGQVLTVAAGQASWQPAPSGSVPTLSNGQILIGNGTVNTPTALSGDATLAAGALTIANNAITNPKLANDAVTTAKILDANVTTAKLADGSVTGLKLAANAINDANIAAGANIAASKLAATVLLDTEAPNATGDITGNFSSGLQIAANAVNTTEINNLAVTDAKIAGVSAGKLAGTVAVANGGTGLATTPGNGQLPIGNGTGYTLAPLTGGAGINIINGAGSITISSTGLTNPMTSPGDIIYGGSGGVPTRLVTGTGFLRGGTTPSYSNVNLNSADVTGTLPVANGGTGLSTFGASAGLLYNSNPTTLGNISNGSANQLLLMTGTTPSWQTMSGDATITGTGALTVANNAITDAKVATGIAGSKIIPNFGSQNILTTGTLTTGSTGQFAVNATGNITRINNIVTSFPAAQGVANSVLTNDGAGNLTWAAGSGWGLTGNLLTGTERIGSDNPQPLAFETNGTERMRLSASGNFGIGTTNPLSTFQLGNTLSLFNDPDPINPQDIFARNVSFDGTNFRYLITAGASAVSLGNERLGLFTFGNGTAGANLLVPPTMRFNMTNVGVGIQVDNPDETLDVNGAVHLRDTGIPTTIAERLYNVGGTLFWGGTSLSSGSGWGLTGNVGTVDGTNFIGTRDNVPFTIRVNDQASGRIDQILNNVFFGYQSGFGNTSGFGNIFVGDKAGQNNTIGNSNTFVGVEAGQNNVDGNRNTFIGERAGSFNTTGVANTFIGSFAGRFNTIGSNNIFIGMSAGEGYDNGQANVMIGRNSGYQGDTGQRNTFVGHFTGQTNVTGNDITLLGAFTDVSSSALSNATAIGYNATVGASNSLVLGGTGADAVKVGIGTTTPAVALDIQATDAVNMPDGTTAQRPASPLPGAMRYNTTENVMEYYNGTDWYFMVPKVAILRDVKAQGTDGGTGTGGVWNTRDLNAVSGDPTVVSLASNQFTLAPGEYIIEASASGFRIDNHKIRIFNPSLAQTLIVGFNQQNAGPGGGNGGNATAVGHITLVSSATLVLQHYLSNGGSSTDLGRPVNATFTPEVYSIVQVKKLR